jgi:hypothetical protein
MATQKGHTKRTQKGHASPPIVLSGQACSGSMSGVGENQLIEFDRQRASGKWDLMPIEALRETLRQVGSVQDLTQNRLHFQANLLRELGRLIAAKESEARDVALRGREA